MASDMAFVLDDGENLRILPNFYVPANRAHKQRDLRVRQTGGQLVADPGVKVSVRQMRYRLYLPMAQLRGVESCRGAPQTLDIDLGI